MLVRQEIAEDIIAGRILGGIAQCVEKYNTPWGEPLYAVFVTGDTVKTIESAGLTRASSNPYWIRSTCVYSR